MKDEVKNVPCEHTDLSPLLKTIAHDFRDKALFLTCLTHKSATEKQQKNSVHGPNNERLEFLGDAVLSLISAQYLYCENGYMNEGDLSRLRAQYVCQENLSKAAKQIGLGDFLLSDKAMRASGCNNSKSVLADALEALIGAVYLDGGLDKARDVIFRILGLPSTKVNQYEKDAKTKLQELVQASQKKAPKYMVLESSGPPHAPTFLVGIKINDELFATGTGENKRSAAQNAALSALERLAEAPLKSFLP